MQIAATAAILAILWLVFWTLRHRVVDDRPLEELVVANLTLELLAIDEKVVLTVFFSRPRVTGRA